MTYEEIRELIRLVQETGIAELEYQSGDNRIRIRNGNSVLAQDIVTLSSASAISNTPAQPPAPATSSAIAAGAAAAPADEEAVTIAVKSPIVGTYYDSPSPDAPSFVKVGDRVHAKQVLCIIESMKLMNEIEAEVSGTIVAKLVENGKSVEYGESLFSIRPL
ncbi:MAG TPA: acetyl-CoA carboxylase biotin carboxyl carrier protein [Bryobacteraceae bacterium]|jgi:acetyl-CoA carboxylase biotin carboxyl carrier protein|nr:acetyl-CoA carboxylase biotin carboxyl carrier protein [Bryobacteraceae bacterium]